MKKLMTVAEVELIRLDANDMICTSQLGVFDPNITVEDENDFQAPSRYNYRGMATEWEANEEW